MRPSIGATLTVSFALVAILAVTANLVAERGGWVITIHDQEPFTTSAFSSAQKSSNESVVKSQQWETTPPTWISSARLLSAIERFERFTLLRAEANNPEIDLEWQAALQELRQADAVFARDARQASARLPTALQKARTSFEQSGQILIAAADERAAAIDSFSLQFEQINSRVNGALDGAWKIFGRVVARQSLVDLGTALDALRQHAVVLTNKLPDEPTLSKLRTSENAFMTLLEANSKSYIRTYGDEWLRELRANFDQMIGARVTIERLASERADVHEQFHRAKQSFIAAIPNDLQIPGINQPATMRAGNVPVAQRTPPIVSIVQASQHSKVAGFADSASLLLKADEWSFGQARNRFGLPMPGTVEANQQMDAAASQQRVMVAWVSSSILLLLIGVSVWTVRSITLPVNRLVRAVGDLTLGKSPQPVERAGFKELDTLTEAFNRMFAEVAAARQNSVIYQNQLEARVEERTHQLQYLAERDPLTSLPNRRQLFAMLNSAIEVARHTGRYVGVMFVDIDNFKNINDSMGHAFGDHILVAIGQRLSATAEPFGFAARLGGDEFMVVYDSAAQAEDVHKAGAGVVDAFHQPLLVEGRELRLSVSVGASVFPDHAQDVHGLLQSADAALYRAKALGRSQMSIFTAELLKLAADKFATEQGLRRAIDDGEFELVFQPELNIESLRTELVEALIRWRMPDGRLIAPGEFLHVAEESGLICEISDWVMRSAIAAAARWHHGAWPEARVAINISPRQLMDPLFVEKLVSLLHEYRLPHKCIELELTESVLQTGAGTIETLKQLCAQDIAIALDDFGTGYSSLASLEQLPLSRVKLDRSLIDSVHTSSRSAAIVRATLTLCHGLGLAVTAEGIELPEQFTFLAGYPGICLQGYLLSKPVSELQLPAAMEKISQTAQELVLLMPEVGSNVVELTKGQRREPRRNLTKSV